METAEHLILDDEEPQVEKEWGFAKDEGNRKILIGSDNEDFPTNNIK
jgi:hypothetical protein